MASGEHRNNVASPPDSCIKSPFTFVELRKDLELAKVEIERHIYERLEHSLISTQDSNEIDAIPSFADDRTKANNRSYPSTQTYPDADYTFSKGVLRESGVHGLIICIPKEEIRKCFQRSDGKKINVSRRTSVCNLVNVPVGEPLPKNKVWVEMRAQQEPIEHQSSVSTISTSTVQSEQYGRAVIFTRENVTARLSPVQHWYDNTDEEHTIKFEFDAPPGSVIIDEALHHQKVAEFLLDESNAFDLKLTQWEYINEAPVLDRFTWYHRDIDHKEAKRRLNGKEVGTFLVRDASQASDEMTHKFTMEIVKKTKIIMRLRILHQNGRYNFEDSAQEGTVHLWQLIVKAIERGLDISKPDEDWYKITAIPLSRVY